MRQMKSSDTLEVRVKQFAGQRQQLHLAVLSQEEVKLTPDEHWSEPGDQTLDLPHPAL